MDHYAETTVTSFDGTPIWYRRIGSGEPTLVLCDGLACDGFIWKYFIPHFEKKHRMIHWNYRGHGKTPAPADPANIGIDEAVEDLRFVLDDAGVKEPCVLVGHSMGVQVILEFAHHHPERVAALIPVTGSYGKAIDHVHDSGVLRQIFPLAKELVARFKPLVGAVSRQLVHSELAYQYACQFEVNRSLMKREDLLPYLYHLSRIDPWVFVRTLESAGKHTAESYLSELKFPTLIVASEADRFTPYWISQRMHALMPGSELLTLPTGSHTGPLELPELMNLKIEKFLEGLRPAA